MREIQAQVINVPMAGSPPTLTDLSRRRRREVVLGQSEHLLHLQVVDVDANVRHDFGCDILVVLFDIGNPAVRCVRLPLTVPQEQNGSGW